MESLKVRLKVASCNSRKSAVAYTEAEAAVKGENVGTGLIASQRSVTDAGDSASTHNCGHSINQRGHRIQAILLQQQQQQQQTAAALYSVPVFLLGRHSTAWLQGISLSVVLESDTRATQRKRSETRASPATAHFTRYWRSCF